MRHVLEVCFVVTRGVPEQRLHQRLSPSHDHRSAPNGSVITSTEWSCDQARCSSTSLPFQSPTAGSRRIQLESNSRSLNRRIDRRPSAAWIGNDSPRWRETTPGPGRNHVGGRSTTTPSRSPLARHHGPRPDHEASRPQAGSQARSTDQRLHRSRGCRTPRAHCSPAAPH
jgi:hypothetical protein